MSTSAPAAVACASCGAIHAPAPGERDLCPACRGLLPAEPPWRHAPPRGAPGQPIGAFRRPAKGNGRAGRTLRRAVLAAAVVLAGVGAALALQRKPLPFVAPQRERPGAVDPAKAPARHVRHSTATATPGRKSHKKAPVKKAKRHLEDANPAGATP